MNVSPSPKVVAKSLDNFSHGVFVLFADLSEELQKEGSLEGPSLDAHATQQWIGPTFALCLHRVRQIIQQAQFAGTTPEDPYR